MVFFFFSSRRRHTRLTCDWSSDVCSSDLTRELRQNLGTADIRGLLVQLRAQAPLARVEIVEIPEWPQVVCHPATLGLHGPLIEPSSPPPTVPPMRRPMRAVLLMSAALALTSCSSGDKSARRLPSTPCGTYDGRGCAPARERVDLTTPTFSHPTRITNPLFPIARLRSAVRGRPRG